jgi:hypothetical protein
VDPPPAAHGAGGGGVSATTIGIVGGAVAAGAIVAKETVLSGGTQYNGQFSGVLPDTIFSAPGSPPFSCTQNEQQTGTIEITLDSTEGSISGTMDVRGDIVLSPGNCPPSDYNNGGKDGFGLEHGALSRIAGQHHLDRPSKATTPMRRQRRGP